MQSAETMAKWRLNCPRGSCQWSIPLRLVDDPNWTLGPRPPQGVLGQSRIEHDVAAMVADLHRRRRGTAKSRSGWELHLFGWRVSAGIGFWGAARRGWDRLLANALDLLSLAALQMSLPVECVLTLVIHDCRAWRMAGKCDDQQSRLSTDLSPAKLLPPDFKSDTEQSDAIVGRLGCTARIGKHKVVNSWTHALA